jgi:hypothetical protein
MLQRALEMGELGLDGLESSGFSHGRCAGCIFGAVTCGSGRTWIAGTEGGPDASH